MTRNSFGTLLRSLLTGAAFHLGLPAGAQSPSVTPAASAPGLTEVLAWRESAQKGDAAAQVALGDFFNAGRQYGEAVFWYRSAATNGEVTAQLALAGFLISGTGTAVNRGEAAYWMRRAADGVERAGGKAIGQSNPRPTPIVMTRSSLSSENQPRNVSAPDSSRETKNLFTNAHSFSTRATRADNLVVVEPSLQEKSADIRPSSVPK